MRVIIIDDHALFRDGLKGLLEQRSIDVAGMAADGNEGIELAKQIQPDIILLDLRMPNMSGLDTLPILRSELPGTPVVMLTTSNDESDLIKALRTGAQGYLLKDMEPEELVGALRDIENGKNVVAADLTDALARMVQGETTIDDDGPFSELTPRETEILYLLADGQSNKLIARNLGISDGTVKLHVKAILRKLNIHSRVEAAVMAVEQGLRNKEKS
ncbi:MAG: response regulator [Gammaproteobacteria bacterium]|nr:response regulator [Gammaproteobacteria bacterium]